MSDAAIPLAEPCLAGNESRYLQECLDSNFVSSVGPFVARFEEAFAAAVGARHAVACASGTAALHVAMRVLGVCPGDEVLVPSLTFIASANAAVYEGASVTFVDAEPSTWNADPALIVDELRRRQQAGEPLPKAVEIVHLLGHPADIEPLLGICSELGIVLVEDAAEALGATYRGGRLDGRQVGTIGRIGCFSFNGNKVITTGGGGMLVTDDESLARRAKHLTTQAKLPGIAYDHDEVGFNYRLSNVAAALGLAQLEQLDTFVAAKRRIAARYDEAFADLDNVEPPPNASWAVRSSWLYSVRLSDPGLGRRVLDRLAAEEIGARPIWPPLHRMRPYAGARLIGSGEVAEQIAATALSLPSSVGLVRSEQERVIAAFRRAVTQG